MLRAAARPRRPARWLRVVDHDDDPAAPLDAAALDAIVVDRPVRVQDRTGALWVLNRAALATIDAAVPADGRFLRADGWLREHLPAGAPSLAPVAAALSRAGVTGVTDATVTNDPAGVRALADAAAAAGMRQRLWVMSGGADLPADPRYTIGPVKIVLDDARLPPPDDVAATIAAAHRAGRAAAIHCVTAAELAIALRRPCRGRHARRRPDRAWRRGRRPRRRRDRRAGADGGDAAGFVSARGDRYLSRPSRRRIFRISTPLRLADRRRRGGRGQQRRALWPDRSVGGDARRRHARHPPAARRWAWPRRYRRAARSACGWARPKLRAERSGASPSVRAADLCMLSCGLDEALDALTADVVRHTFVAGDIV
ncbi:MAG: hypothetical protein PGN08_06050 [Sphingomonas taxi]